MIIKHLSQVLKPKIKNQNEKVKEEVPISELESFAYKLSISDYGLKYMRENTEIKLAIINTDVESYNRNLTLNKKDK